MSSNESITGALSLARNAARRSADRLKALLAGPIEVDSSAGRDVKLAADREAEQLIVGVLQQGSSYPVLSEESGWIGGSVDGEMRWVVDPLDGSFNFLRGIPICCVSIALWSGAEPLLGVVHDVHSGEVFSGVVGRGAWVGDDRPVHVSSVNTSSNAVLCTGFPVGTDFSRAALTEYVEQVRNFKKIRLLGSAALSLAYVAAGRAEAYYERGIKIWDVAAGIAIVKAAGGTVVCTPVDPKTHALTVDASNGYFTRGSV